MANKYVSTYPAERSGETPGRGGRGRGEGNQGGGGAANMDPFPIFSRTSLHRQFEWRPGVKVFWGKKQNNNNLNRGRERKIGTQEGEEMHMGED